MGKHDKPKCQRKTLDSRPYAQLTRIMVDGQTYVIMHTAHLYTPTLTHTKPYTLPTDGHTNIPPPPPHIHTHPRHTSTHKQTNTHTHAHSNTHIHTNPSARAYAGGRRCTRTSTHTHIQTRTHRYAHTYIPIIGCFICFEGFHLLYTGREGVSEGGREVGTERRHGGRESGSVGDSNERKQLSQSYTYIHKYTQTIQHKHTHIHRQIYTHASTCIHICIHGHTQYTHKHEHTHSCMHTHIHTYPHKCMYTITCIRAHTHIYIHMHANTYTVLPGLRIYPKSTDF